MHGAGEWDFYEISSSISQFLLCTAYLHHALSGFDIDEPIIDEEDKLFLADEAAEWFFAKIKECDPLHYEDWASIFENS
jgi:hypothetical protein